ncbi:unnamed protein product [Rotaria sp. Silwood1]|nr:unnamed protein product [Rotaria sp. Silwood1]
MEQLYSLIREKIKEKQEGIQRVVAEIVAGMIRGSKYWTVEMLDELWSKLTPFLNEAFMNISSEAVNNWCLCFRGKHFPDEFVLLSSATSKVLWPMMKAFETV